ncbi:MAG: hypothetical protein ACPKPY_02960 [Nitrososphaeraceae archaeon]
MKNNNLTLVSLFLTLSIFFSVSGSIPGYAQEENQTIVEPQFLSLQHAQSGTISEINATFYKLELNQVSDETIEFSERPDRIIKTISTEEFITECWSLEIPNNYQINPPNADLIIHDNKLNTQMDFIIEIFNPVYDKDENTLMYDFKLLSNATTLADLPKEIGKTNLFIDPK